jgi:uncharacterized protein YbjT (DUF2867 family)
VRAWSGKGAKVVVTGATGAVGRHVTRFLAADCQVRLLVRDAGRAAALALPGDVVVGDYADRPLLARVLDGADSVFVVTADPLRPEQDEHILAAARAGGVRRAVRMSWLAVADPDADDLIARWNRHAEELMRGSGLDWTVLRMRTPMTGTLSWAASIRAERVVRALGGDARTACVDPRDVAEVAVRALTGPGHEGRTYALTGPEPLSAREQTAQLARALGQPLAFEELTREQAMERWRAKLPEPVAVALREAADRRADAAASHVTNDVATVTGRPAGTFEQWAKDHIDAFR